MTIETQEERAFLFELYTITQGDTAVSASMYDVGEAVGLEKDQAGSMAESLFIQGYAELKTLSGGIGITPQGLEALDIQVAPTIDEAKFSLGTGRTLDDKEKESIDQILTEIKEGVSSRTLAYPELEELIIDIKTIEVQLLSPLPKTDIIREILKSLHHTLTASKETDTRELEAKLDSMIQS